MRKAFKKLRPKIIKYGSYKQFSNEAFSENLQRKLVTVNFVNNDNVFERYFWNHDGHFK